MSLARWNYASCQTIDPNVQIETGSSRRNLLAAFISYHCRNGRHLFFRLAFCTRVSQAHPTVELGSNTIMVRILTTSSTQSSKYAVATTRFHYIFAPLVLLILVYVGTSLFYLEDAFGLRGEKVSAAGMQGDFSLAFDESLGFFDDIPQVDWGMHKDWARMQIDHRYATTPTRHYHPANIALWYYNNFNPVFNCPHAKRVWGLGDGPKWVCDPHRLIRVAQRREAAGEPGPHCIIYSVGSNGNYEFEDGMIQQIGTICEIHVFDYSKDYERPQNKERNIHFHQWGLRARLEKRSQGEFYTFPEILLKLGHEKKTIDIFKIDCEGCEWDTQGDWIHQDIRQVLVETHELPKNSSFGLKYFQSYKKNQFAMFSKEVNGFGEGKFYEFSYIKLHPLFWGPESATV
jgi:Methyltransferase domain